MTGCGIVGWYQWEKNSKNYIRLSDELWYAAGGITVIVKTSFNTPLYLMDQVTKAIYNDFIYALDNERLIDAAMLYDALIVMTDMASYIEHNLSKNFMGGKHISGGGERILGNLVRATETSYDKIVYGMYPPSRVGLGGAVDLWYTLKSPRKSKILDNWYTTGVTKKKIEDMHYILWTLTSSYSDALWGAKDMVSQDHAKSRMNYVVNHALERAEVAEDQLRRGHFLEAAVAYSEAVFNMDLYFKYRKTTASRVKAPELKEIDIQVLNSFNSISNAMIDLIGI